MAWSAPRTRASPLARSPASRPTRRGSSRGRCAPPSASAAGSRQSCRASSCRSREPCSVGWWRTSSSMRAIRARRRAPTDPGPGSTPERQPPPDEAVLGAREAARRLEGTRALLARPDVDYVLDQGLGDGRASQPVGVRRGRRRHRRGAHAALRAGRRREPGEVRQPRHGGIQGSRPHDRGLHRDPRQAAPPLPRSRNRAAGLPARRARRLPALARVGPGPPGGGRRGYQGARREGREPADGASGCRPSRLAARDVGLEAAERHQLQARARGGAAPGPRSTPSESASRATNSSTSRSPTALAARARRCVGGRVRDALGMAPAQAEVVRRDVGGLLLYTPVVAASDFDSAIAYLVRRLEEGASHDTSCRRSSTSPTPRRCSRASATASSPPSPTSTTGSRAAPRSGPRGGDRGGPGQRIPQHSRQRPVDRGEPRVGSRGDRAGAVDRPRARHRREVDDRPRGGARVARRRRGAGGGCVGGSRGAARANSCTAPSRARASSAAATTSRHGGRCGQDDRPVRPRGERGPIDFAHLLRRAGPRPRAPRWRRVRVGAGDPRDPAVELPRSRPAGSTLAGLASGSAVHPEAVASVRRGPPPLLAEALWAAGVPREVLGFVAVLGCQLRRASHRRPADRPGHLTGGFETAEHFRGFRPGLKPSPRRAARTRW